MTASPPSPATPPMMSTSRGRALNWAAVVAALPTLLLALSSYVRSKAEPQAQGAYDTLSAEVVKLEAEIGRLHDEGTELRAYIAQQNGLQDHKIAALDDALQHVATPQPAAPPPVHVQEAVASARAVVRAPKQPPPPVQAPKPPPSGKEALDRSFKERTSVHETAL